jgi:hypothetical protein
MTGHINFDMKVLGKCSTGNLCATFDVAGAKNGKDCDNYWVRGWKRRIQIN